MYRNEGVIDDLFEWTMDFAHLETTIEKVSKKTVEASTEGGVDTGPILSLFIKLKAALKSSASMAHAVRTVATEDNRLDLLAVAEAILEREGKVTYDPAQVETSEYFHFQDAFDVFPPGAEDELLARVGEQLGKAIIKRWKSDSSLLPGTPQFVYAAGQPQPMAAVLIAPPNPEKGIRGSSNAAYPTGQNRVLFGRFGAVQDGVRFINTMYYVADGVVAA